MADTGVLDADISLRFPVTVARSAAMLRRNDANVLEIF